MRRRIGRRLSVLTVALALGLVGAGMSPAAAGPRVNCVASGVVNVTPGSPAQWSLTGAGLCADFLQGPYSIAFFGQGTSDALGLCGDLVVTNLRLRVSVILKNVSTGTTRTINETWGAPITTFPLATPFVVGGGGAPGLGAMFTRILLRCPPAGSNGATFVWSQAT